MVSDSVVRSCICIGIKEEKSMSLVEVAETSSIGLPGNLFPSHRFAA